MRYAACGDAIDAILKCCKIPGDYNRHDEMKLEE
jgi:hypothetical protein